MNTADKVTSLEDDLLITMLQISTAFSPLEACFHLKPLARRVGVTRDMARALCRKLTDDGFCRYQNALWTDGGEPAGSGYGLTPEGVRRASAAALERSS